MQIKNNLQTYGFVTKLFHWLTGVMIISVMSVGFVMAGMEKSDLKWKIYGAHKATGILILSLVSLRFLWRLWNIQPEMQIPKWEKILSNINFIFLYIVMFAMPITGMSMSLIGGKDISFFGMFTIPSLTSPKPEVSKLFWQAHGVIAYILLVLISLHILASLYHHFIKKDDVLKKML